MDCRIKEKKDNIIYYVEEGQAREPALALGVLCVQKYLGNVNRQVQMLFPSSFSCCYQMYNVLLCTVISQLKHV